MFLSSPTKILDVSFRVSHGESSYMVYATTETLQCFECGDIGHKRFTCPHKAHNTEEEGPSETSDRPQIVTESTPQQPEMADTNIEVKSKTREQPRSSIPAEKVSIKKKKT